MRENPLIISLLIGLIVVLVIGGVSLLVKMNDLSNIYKKELAKNISSQKSIEDLKVENKGLDENILQLNSQVKSLMEEKTKLESLKEKLEKNLEEELMKKKLSQE